MISKFTWSNLAALNKLNSVDKTNLTETKRGLKKYAQLLGVKHHHNGQNTDPVIVNYILDLHRSLGHTIRILDAGCGSSVAIDQLLSHPKLTNIVESITGVSMHHFSNTYNVLVRHQKRFIYYLGDVQSVLTNEFTNHFDLILDSCGAFLYSEDKINILKQYYQSLRLNGQALIHVSRDSIYYSSNGSKIDWVNLFEQNYSNTFQFNRVEFTNKYGLCMTKKSVIWPLPNYTIRESNYRPVFNNPKDNHSADSLSCGNAMAYDHVLYSHKSSVKN